MKIRLFTLAMLQAVASFSVYAARVDQADLALMQKIAHEDGAVRVAINFTKIQPLSLNAEEYKKFEVEIEEKAEILKLELGNTFFKGGYWKNPTGEIGLTLKPEGLAILENSQNAISFRRDRSEGTRTFAHNVDNSLYTLRKKISSEKIVATEIVLNVPTAQYALLRDGSTKVTQTDEVIAEVSRLKSQLAQATSENSRFNNSIRADTSNPVVLIADVDLDSFIALQSHPAVRSLRPLGYKDPRPTTWSSWSAEEARQEGSIEFSITLRGGIFFSPTVMRSAIARKNQEQANRQAFAEIFADVGMEARTGSSTSVTLGTIHTRLTPEQWNRLKSNADPRLLEVTANRIGGGNSMQYSVPSINAPVAWTSGYTGAGQTIFIVDEGIRKSHDMFTVGGVSRVVGEDCFGSNSGAFKSVCPLKDNIYYDSPPLTPGAGEPYSNLVHCQIIDATRCGHGTKMASIAAGHYTPTVGGGTMQGVAPGASLYAINVFSYKYQSSPYLAQYFIQDINAAFNRIIGLATASPSLPASMVVNLSIGTIATFGYDCDAAAFDSVTRSNIHALYVVGVPVIASTGNKGIQNGISHPACSEYAIKVGAMPNDAVSTTKASYSNLAPSANYSRPVFLAPGGEATIFGAPLTGAGRVSNTDTLGGWGTSEAAAHVSGLAALYKGRFPTHGVDEFVDWLTVHASVPISLLLAGQLYTFQRVNYSNNYTP